jgi:cytochrome P450
VKKGSPINLDLSNLSSVVDAIRHSESIDDRKFLLEHALSFVSRLKEGPLQQELQEKIIKLLYNDLPHPASTCVGNKFNWRSADGSGNNLSAPDLGKAKTPYARSVQPSQALPYNQLPDPGLLFDTLLKREGFVKHPAGLSSLFFAFAALVIHTVFRTSHQDVNLNETSSYVDLAPLYGHDQHAQNRIRVRDGYGLIHPDCFAEDRLLLLPPAVCVILVLFSRNHNYIAKKLFEINEKQTFKNITGLSEHQKAAQDEEIFQVARLVNCGWFGSVVFSDYFSCILGLVRQGNSWVLNPFPEMRNSDHSMFERGRGNVCSVEFNCLYRWHATISVEDEQWTEKIFTQLFNNKPVEEVTIDDFKKAAKQAQAMEPDVSQWTFGNLKRQESGSCKGSFKDDDLANILQNATEHPAAAFRARGTPAIMRLNEIMGIEQSRKWGCCSLNDFRKYLGLKPYKSFLEWNPNPIIADAAEKLYGDIERLELYVGLQAEESKPVMDGAGLCPGFTISRAILSDAIALTRGDRFFTYDYSPQNLTAWGFADCQRDPNAFGFGSTLGRLFLRNLPNNYTENSVYAFFPLMTPGAMKTHLSNMHRLDDYDVIRPKSQAPPRVISQYAQVGEILTDKDNFITDYAGRAGRAIKGKGFYTVENDVQQEAVVHALVEKPDDEKHQAFIDQVGQYYYKMTRKLLEENSFPFVGGKTRGVDVVRHVLKVVPVYWAATEVAGIKLKTKPSDDDAKYTPLELYDMLADIYSLIFLEVDKSKFMVLGEEVVTHINELVPLISTHAGISKLSFIEKFGTAFRRSKKSEHSELVKRVQEITRSTDQLTNTLLALMVSATAEVSLALTNMINLYLGSTHSSDISALAASSEVEDKLHGYCHEAMRIDPPFRGVYRTAKEKKEVLGLTVEANERVFLDMYTANTHEKTFQNPHRADPSRDKKAAFYADGLHKSLGEPLTTKILSEVLRAVFSFKNVRRAPGNSGQLQRFKDGDHLQLCYSYLGPDQFPTAWPSSLTIEYDV